MNKKLLRALLAAIAMVLCLALCSCTFLSALSAYSLYTQANKKLEKAGGFEADCVLTMDFDIMGESMSVTTDMNIKQNGDNLSTVTEVEGEKIVVTLIDDKMYIEYNDDKMKYSITKDDAEGGEDEEAIPKNTVIPGLTKEALENIEVVKGEDGKKIISLALDDEAAKQILGSALEGDETTTLEDINLEIVFTKNNEFDSMKLTCRAVVSTMGVTVSSDLTADYTFVNIGEAPEITLAYPESEYVDGGEYTE